ncbi:hypothetical protein SDC9_137886 [bioreactor metagenome]|uniref:Uncharacterized protein n=1 Tax=bioreactor metagenome TaxID=1076179 RepID=A0A645DMU3_9ZZZZ
MIVGRLQAELAQIDLAVLHRWAPQIAAGDRAREAEQAVLDAVFQPGHAAHLGLERVERAAEGRKHQAAGVAAAFVLQPGHGAAQHEGLGLEALLRGALDVGGYGRVFQLLVVRQATAHDVVALGGAEAFKLLIVVQPLLIGQKARPVHTGACALHEGGGFGVLTLGVFGAVFVARQIMRVAVVDGAVAERIHHMRERQRRAQQRGQGAGAVEQLAHVATPQPQHQRCRGGRHDGVLRALHGGEFAQAGHLGTQRRNQLRADGGNDRFTIHQRLQPREARAQRGGVGLGGDGEEGVPCKRRNGLENAALEGGRLGGGAGGIVHRCNTTRLRTLLSCTGDTRGKILNSSRNTGMDMGRDEF